jgi:hypothetical protein
VTAGLRETWRSLGEPEIVTAHSSCLKTLGEFLPETNGRSLWAVLREIARPPLAGPLAIHAPCAGRLAFDVQGAVRRLAAGLGVEPGELGSAARSGLFLAPRQ